VLLGLRLNLLRACCAVALALLSACGSAPVRHRGGYYDGAPPTPVDISNIPEPVPKFEPLARYGNQTPYAVLGQNYTVLPSRVGYVQRGTASWYGTKFHGKLTSNREPYDMYAFTAAHKSLPLPVYARVTNLENRKSIIVRINDRGPFVSDRIIDLSYVAALKLDMQSKGTALVEVETLTPGEFAPLPVVQTANPSPKPAQKPLTPQTAPVLASPPAASKPMPGDNTAPGSGLPSRARDISPPSGTREIRLPSGTREIRLVTLQCGAFSDFANANALKIALLNAGFSDARVISGQDRLNRVVLGPLVDLAAAEDVSQSLQAQGFAAPKVLTP
jgi:rare lipoprotein A